MTPKMPPVAAFRLLYDLNEFMAHSPEERQSVLDYWVEALDRRTPMLEALETDREAAAVDRAAAAQGLQEATETTHATIDTADTTAREIIAAATRQAESINKKVAENVAEAQADAETAARQAQERDVQAATAFKEREDAVKSREEAVEELGKATQIATDNAAAVKAEYQALIDGISALQRRAPK